jgi:hypothetical protein
MCGWPAQHLVPCEEWSLPRQHWTKLMFTRFKPFGTLWGEKRSALRLCTQYLFAGSTCSRPEVPMARPKVKAFIARPFLQVNHHRPIADILLHVWYVNKARHISDTYHVPRWFLQHLCGELACYSTKHELLGVVYRGQILRTCRVRWDAWSTWQCRHRACWCNPWQWRQTLQVCGATGMAVKIGCQDQIVNI